MCCAGQLGPFARAEVALQLLLALAQLQPAAEATGQVLQPLPMVHRQLASPACLPHLAQVSLPFAASQLCSLCFAMN